MLIILKVSWTEEDDKYLQNLILKIPDGIKYEIWDTNQIYINEPNLRRNPIARKGLFIPDESVIDPFAFPLLLLRLAIQKGASIKLNSELLSADYLKDRNLWKILISDSKKQQNQIIFSKILINCAGNYGDIVESRIFKNQNIPFKITPRKGQFIVYENSKKLLNSTILPIPTERTKGVLVCSTIYGNIIVGPTAEDQEEREIASIDDKTKEFLKNTGETIFEELKNMKITGMYAGLRPASQHRDYQIKFDDTLNFVCVAGIRSTGLTACMGIAEYISRNMLNWDICKLFTSQDYIIPNNQTMPPSFYCTNGTKILYKCELGTTDVSHSLPKVALGSKNKFWTISSL